MQAPQRSNGKLRVAAIMKAAAHVIAEKGYDATTMAEIAGRSATKIGSLYRFFPNKESLADTMVVSARENVDAVFDRFDAGVKALSIRDLADHLLPLLEQAVTPGLMKLLDAGQDWSAKRGAFRKAVLRRIAKTLAIYRPKLPTKAAEDIAFVLLLNMKAVRHYKHLASAPSALEEIREMTRLYLRNRLGPSASAKRVSA